MNCAGIDPRRYTVGHRANSVNPRTGKPEFGCFYGDPGECFVPGIGGPPRGIEQIPALPPWLYPGVSGYGSGDIIAPGRLGLGGPIGDIGGTGGGGGNANYDPSECKAAKQAASELEFHISNADTEIQQTTLSRDYYSAELIKLMRPSEQQDQAEIVRVSEILSSMNSRLATLTKDRASLANNLERLKWQNSNCFEGLPT